MSKLISITMVFLDAGVQKKWRGVLCMQLHTDWLAINIKQPYVSTHTTITRGRVDYKLNANGLMVIALCLLARLIKHETAMIVAQVTI